VALGNVNIGGLSGDDPIGPRKKRTTPIFSEAIDALKEKGDGTFEQAQQPDGSLFNSGEIQQAVSDRTLSPSEVNRADQNIQLASIQPDFSQYQRQYDSNLGLVKQPDLDPEIQVANLAQIGATSNVVTSTPSVGAGSPISVGGGDSGDEITDLPGSGYLDQKQPTSKFDSQMANLLKPTTSTVTYPRQVTGDPFDPLNVPPPLPTVPYDMTEVPGAGTTQSNLDFSGAGMFESGLTADPDEYIQNLIYGTKFTGPPGTNLDPAVATGASLLSAFAGGIFGGGITNLQEKAAATAFNILKDTFSSGSINPLDFVNGIKSAEKILTNSNVDPFNRAFAGANIIGMTTDLIDQVGKVTKNFQGGKSFEEQIFKGIERMADNFGRTGEGVRAVAEETGSVLNAFGNMMFKGNAEDPWHITTQGAYGFQNKINLEQPEPGDKEFKNLRTQDQKLPVAARIVGSFIPMPIVGIGSMWKGATGRGSEENRAKLAQESIELSSAMATGGVRMNTGEERPPYVMSSTGDTGGKGTQVIQAFFDPPGTGINQGISIPIHKVNPEQKVNTLTMDQYKQLLPQMFTGIEGDPLRHSKDSLDNIISSTVKGLDLPEDATARELTDAIAEVNSDKINAVNALLNETSDTGFMGGKENEPLITEENMNTFDYLNGVKARARAIQFENYSTRPYGIDEPLTKEDEIIGAEDIQAFPPLGEGVQKHSKQLGDLDDIPSPPPPAPAPVVAPAPVIYDDDPVDPGPAATDWGGEQGFAGWARGGLVR